MGPKVKDQEVRDQVSTNFLEALQCDLTYGERISLVAHCNLALFQLQCRFFCFGIHFLDFGPVFWCHGPKREKHQLDILKEHFMLDISK